MTPHRLGPDRKEIEAWIQFSLENMTRQQASIAVGERDQTLLTGMHVNCMTLGRSRYLHAIWFGDQSTRAAVKEARTAFQNAAQYVEMSFRMAYDPMLPEYLGDQANWSCVMELDAIEGFTAAFMAGDFALARRFAPWPRRSPDNDPMDAAVCNYVDALQAYLQNDPGAAAQFLHRNLDQFNPKKSGKRDFRMNYHTLSTALLGIVEKNTVRFNGGLAAQLEFYEPAALHGEEAETSQEFICDHAVALANLGLWAGLKINTRHRLLPMDLLINTHPPVSK